MKKLNDIITAVLLASIAGLGTMTIFVYSDSASQGEKIASIKAMIVKNEEAIEEIKNLIAAKTSDRFTKDDGRILDYRLWDNVQRVAALEK